MHLNTCNSCIFSELVVMNLWWKQLAAVVMIMQDSWESLSLPLTPSLPPFLGSNLLLSGCLPVILCRTCSDLISMFHNICVCSGISYTTWCHLFIFVNWQWANSTYFSGDSSFKGECMFHGQRNARMFFFVLHFRTWLSMTFSYYWNTSYLDSLCKRVFFFCIVFWVYLLQECSNNLAVS